MRLAVIADIHGNADALAAVLADLRGLAPDAIVNLGDCFSGPLDAARTADLLDSAGIAVTVRGNHDRWLLDATVMDDWDCAAYPLLSPATMAWLAGLPATAVIDDVFMCHATPQDDLSYWVEARATDGTRCLAGLDAIAARAEGIGQGLMLCGHTHVARVARLPDGRLVANPGSVGCPGFRDQAQPGARPFSVGTPFAAYGVFDRTGPTWTVMHRHVPYDTGPAVARARAAGWEDWASALATGWV